MTVLAVLLDRSTLFGAASMAKRLLRPGMKFGVSPFRADSNDGGYQPILFQRVAAGAGGLNALQRHLIRYLEALEVLMSDS